MDNKLPDWINEIQYKELIEETNNCPHKILGKHEIDEKQIITAVRFNAKSVKVTDEERNNGTFLEKIGEDGLYGINLPKRKYKNYLLETVYLDGTTVVTEDPYSYEPVITSLDIHLFGEGKHYEIYEKLGAHIIERNGVYGTYFAVWAPNARRVSVVGDFNCWDGRLHPMRMLEESGIHELFIPHVGEGAIYKFQIKTRTGELLYKTDPYGNCGELRPGNASVVAVLNDYNWNDNKWMTQREKTTRNDYRKKPMSIYEVHIGSWKKYNDGTEDGFYHYKEMAHELADYLCEMGYTHVELMGIAEHPFDGSWGYQVTGYYAPTRRYGLPRDFMYFVDYMHQRGISVILDWVPAHFPKDEHGLGRFDGMALYEHPDKRRGEHPHWGTYIFDYGRKEVDNFLLANALFWIEKFHIDGLRVDAVASMLYLDYGRENGEWIPNKNGGRENLDAVSFLQHMNQVVEDRVPGAVIIAEESTAWEGVSAPVSLGGLGFLFKWNMGWMNDFLEYMKLDPYFRQYNQNKITFGMMYAYSENFIQVLSHDEVVHGKGSMITKMPGEYYDKFSNLRAAYGFMYAHPGKKLLFMGQEFAQWREWNEKESLDWALLGEEKHFQMQQYVKALNHLYQKYEAMYVNDYNSIGFEWINCSQAEMSTVSFVRRGESKKSQLLIICNFIPVAQEHFKVGVPCSGKYKEVLNSDSIEFGGSGTCNKKPLVAEEKPWDEKEYSIEFDLPPLSTVIFEYDYVEKTDAIENKKEIVHKLNKSK